MQFMFSSGWTRHTNFNLINMFDLQMVVMSVVFHDATKYCINNPQALLSLLCHLITKAEDSFQKWIMKVVNIFILVLWCHHVFLCLGCNSFSRKCIKTQNAFQFFTLNHGHPPTDDDGKNSWEGRFTNSAKAIMPGWLLANTRCSLMISFWPTNLKTKSYGL